MNITTYFLKHPVISFILNAMIMIVGVLCFDSLSVREYPEVHFPKVEVFTHYHNASAELIESTVTNALEDRLAGVEGIETITSDSKHGSSRISLSFKNGTSIDKALMAIREAIGLAQLPAEVNPPLLTEEQALIAIPSL